MTAVRWPAADKMSSAVFTDTWASRTSNCSIYPLSRLRRLLESIDERITTIIGIGHVIDRKQAALHSHDSQIGDSRPSA